MAIDTRKILHTAFDKHTENVDNYNHNGSTWLIFTDEKKWVIELTKEGTLWYNYYFFQNIMKLLSLEVVENQHYITEWVEDNIISKVKKTRRNGDSMNTEAEDAIEDGVKQTKRSYEGSRKQRTKDTIQNGVKHTSNRRLVVSKDIEDTIQNGVKRTLQKNINRIGQVEDAIKNGVKETKSERATREWKSEQVIENGVKETKLGAPDNRDYFIEDAIQNGVKHTIDTTHHRNKLVEDTIQNGVKHTHPMGKDKESIVSNDFGMNEAIQNGVKRTDFNIYIANNRVKDTIQNGVKVTYSDKIPHEYDWSNQFTEEIDDIIQNGVKHTKKSLQIDYSCVIEDVIKEGVKHTEYGDWEDGDERLDDIIKNGVKETTPGGYLGSVEMKGKIVHQFEHSKQDDDVKDVIKNGIKKTEAAALFDEESKMDTVISNGIKETHDDAYHHTGRVGGVIKNGVKQCIPSRTPLYNPMDFSVQYRENHRLDDVASVLEKGIKEVQPLPSQEGNMDWGNYYHKQEDRTKPHTKYVDDVITNGIKKTKAMDEWVNTDRIVDGVISKGVKKSPI